MPSAAAPCEHVPVQAVPGGAKKVPGVDVILDLVGASHFPKNLQALPVQLLP